MARIIHMARNTKGHYRKPLMRNLDFSSWHTLLSTLLGLAFITLIGVGIRLLIMQTIQQRRERENRQINERLRTLIAAYKTLGSSFTGNLMVDPTHLRDLRLRAKATLPDNTDNEEADDDALTDNERARRIRDAVEAALSDIILLGTEEQVKLAAQAAAELSAGRPIHTAELVISLRAFIRKALDLEPIAEHLVIPRQGPARPSAARGKNDNKGGNNKGGGGKGGGGGGAAAGMGLGLAGSHASDDSHDPHQ